MRKVSRSILPRICRFGMPGLWMDSRIGACMQPRFDWKASTQFQWKWLYSKWTKINKRRVRSVVKHLSANPKVPGSILGPVSYRVHGLWWRMYMYKASYSWSGPQLPKGCGCYAQKDPRFPFEKRRGQPREFRSLVSTIDGSTLPQDCVEEQLSWTQSNW